MSAVSENRPRRRDAERNREAILVAAGEAFAEGGLAAGVDQIARRAGVGPATLYRHFPSKADLVDAVLEHRATGLCEVVRASSTIEDPAEAMRDLVHRVVDVQARDRSFRDLLAWHDAESARDVPALAELGALIGAIFERARAAGVVRADAALEDLLLILIATDEVSQAAAAAAPRSIHRLADILVDGLLQGTTPLRGEPVPLDRMRGVAEAGRGLPRRPS